MIFTDSRGITTGRWQPNMMLIAADINYLHQSAYQNATDMLVLSTTQEAANEVLRGLELLEDTGLDVDVSPGAAVSFDGVYFVNDVFGFSASAGAVYSVINPITQSITFDTGVGMGNPRVDTVEIRPKQVTWNNENRQFKDPVTKLVSSANVATRIEYTCEIQILKGTEAASPVAPTATAGWIKLAEVEVAVSQSTIVQTNINDYRDSGSWTTEASSTVETIQKGIGSGTSFPAFPTFGDEFYRTDSDKWFKWNSATWVEI